MLVSEHRGCKDTLLQRRVDRILSVLLCSVIRRTLAVHQTLRAATLPLDRGAATHAEVIRRLQSVSRERQISEGERSVDGMLPDVESGSMRSVTPAFANPVVLASSPAPANRPRPNIPAASPDTHAIMAASFEEFSDSSETELMDMSMALMSPGSPGSMGRCRRDRLLSGG